MRGRWAPGRLRAATGRVIATAALALAAASPSAAHEAWGVATTPDGRIYFADAYRRIVWRLHPDGTLTRALERTDTHALVTIGDGAVYGTDAPHGEAAGRVWRLDAAGGVRTLLAADSHRPLDLRAFLIDTDGTLYFPSRASASPIPALLRLRTDGTVERVSENLEAIHGMAWAPDGAILLTDGVFLRRIALDGRVETLGGGPLTAPRRGAALRGVATDGSGGAFVADFARGRIHNVGRHAGVALEYASNFPWSPTGIARDAEGLVVLEHIAPPWSILGRIQAGPYLRVRRLGVEGRVVTLAVLWGARTWMAATLVAAAALGGIALHIRRYRRGGFTSGTSV